MTALAEVRDLPLCVTTGVDEAVPVRVALSQMRARAAEACLVLSAEGRLLGLARWEKVVAKTRENFDAPLSSVGTERVLVVEPHLPLIEAATLMERPDVAGLAARLPNDRGWLLVTRRALSNTPVGRQAVKANADTPRVIELPAQ